MVAFDGSYFRDFFVLKSKNPMITTKQIMIVFSLLETAIHSFFVLNLESLGLFVVNFVPTIFNQAHSLSIWLGNLKSNGGPLSNFPKPKPLKLSKIGLKPKSPKQKGLQPQNLRYPFGPSLCLAQLQKTLFLQILLIGPISKVCKPKQVRLFPNLQAQTQKMKKTQLHHQPSCSKTKTCASDSPSLPLSKENINIFNNLCLRESTGSKIPRDQMWMLSSYRFNEEWKNWTHKWCDSILDSFKKKPETDLT